MSYSTLIFSILSVILKINPNKCATDPFQLTDTDIGKINSDLSYLKDGVSRISLKAGNPGSMYTFGKFSYALGSTEDGSNVWTASRLGNGKICALAHTAFCDADADMLKLYDNTRMIQNCINWISNKTEDTSMKVGLIMTGLKYDKGFEKSPKSNFNTLEDLKGVHFIVANAGWLNGDKINVAKDFVQQGGGLMVCQTSWAVYGYSVETINSLLFGAGVSWADTTVGASDVITTTPSTVANLWKSNGWHAARLALQTTPPTVPTVLELLANFPVTLPTKFGSPDKVEEASYVSQLMKNLHYTAIYEKYCKINITFPVDKWLNSKEYSCINLINSMKDQIPSDLNHPIVKAASIIPGYPNTLRKTNSITVIVPLNNRTKWQSTGVFLWAGSTLFVTVPSSLTNGKYKFQIGCHKDSLLKLDSFQRWPEVTQSIPITSTTLSFYSYSGGLIYLEIEEVNKDFKEAEIKFTGSIVSSARFVLGKTKESDWLTAIAATTAPFSEIETKNLVVTTKSAHLQKVKNVTELANWYEGVMAKIYDMNGQDEKPYKERFVMDIQISAGGAHAGYPIMAYDYGPSEAYYSWTTGLLTPSFETSLVNGVYGPFEGSESEKHWGVYHEMGHNFQKNTWTNSNDGEVTNNIFALFLSETYVDGPYQFGHYDFGPGTNTHGGTLDRFVDLRQAFGWEAFRRFFHTVESNKTSTNNANDNWLKYFSQTVKRDITSLFVNYKLAVSDDAKSFAKQYPPWNSDSIVDCKVAAFSNSPCATSTANGQWFLLNIVTYARINVTEALEISFKGTSNAAENDMYIHQEDSTIWKSVAFNKTSQTARLIPKNFIPSDSKVQDIWLYSWNPAFTYTEITIKVVNVATNKVVHYKERKLEGLYPAP